jgi:RecB family exonuclease
MRALARALQRDHPGAARDIAERFDETAAERAEKALFLTALTRATHSLVISVPARIAGESTLPARVLGVGERGYRVEEAPRRESPCARAAHAVSRTSPDDARAARLRAIDPPASWWVTPPSPQRLPALGSFDMSASKLNSYARCARQFFYEKVLKIGEPESIYLRVGELVHEALKEIVTPGATRDEVCAALRHAGTREIAERLVSAKFADSGAWMRELSVKYLDDMLHSVAELEAQRAGNYRVRMVEEDVKDTIEGMPLRGRMDRVDDVEGLGPVVIDYKTSGNVETTYPTVVRKMEDKYWQIPVYATMAAHSGIDAAAFVYFALPPGEESRAVGVQVAAGTRPAPIPTGTRAHPRYGSIEATTIAEAMARAVEIHRSIIDGECAYERTANRSICPNCLYARICQRSRASL